MIASLHFLHQLSYRIKMDFNTLTDDEIRAKLTEAGIPVGPIVGMILYFSLLTIYLMTILFFF